MLLIETYINISPGRGFGLFAKTNLIVGTKYWVRNEIFDKILLPEELNLLAPIASDYFTKYGFLERTGCWYLCGDNARFSNHSPVPNTQNHFSTSGLLEYCTISKDINIGEEIFIDYTNICLTCKDGVNFSEEIIL